MEFLAEPKCVVLEKGERTPPTQNSWKLAVAASRPAGRTSLYLACCAKKHLATGGEGNVRQGAGRPMDGRTEGQVAKSNNPSPPPRARKQPRHPPHVRCCCSERGRPRPHLHINGSFPSFSPSFHANLPFCLPLSGCSSYTLTPLNI